MTPKEVACRSSKIASISTLVSIKKEGVTAFVLHLNAWTIFKYPTSDKPAVTC